MKHRLGLCWPLLFLLTLPPSVAMADEDDELLNPTGKVDGKTETSRISFLASELLTGDSFKVRLQAANILGKTRDLRAVRPLVIGLGDAHFAVRGTCAIALGALGDSAAAPPLIELLQKDAEPWVRREVAKALGELRHEKTVPALLVALDDKRWKVKHAAVVSLGKIGDLRAVAPLVARMDEPLEAKEVREAAREALANLREHIDAGAQVMALKQNSDRDARKLAARLLGVIGGPLAVDALLDAINDEDSLVRLTVIETLELLGDPRSVGPLETLIRHEKNQNVKRRAENCLQRLKSH